MATIKSKHTPKLSINEQHEYMTLRTPNGNFTCSYGGAKASGKIASAFRALDNYINKQKPEGITYGEHFQTLLDPKVLERFYPEWDAPLNVVKVGDIVRLTDVFAKKYPNPGKVVSVSRKTAQVQFENEKMGFDMSYMEKIN